MCVVVMCAGSIWSGWDMFVSRQEPLIQGWDDSHLYFWLPSLVIDGDLDFTNQLKDCSTVTPEARDEGLAAARTETGLLPNKYPPGWALGSLPFFLVAHAIAPPGTTGFEPGYMIAVWMGQMAYAAAGLWLAVQVVSRFHSGPAATIAVLGVWLASPLLYYQSSRLAMSHSQVFFLAAAAVWFAFRISEGDDRRRTWAMLGFFAAMLFVTRNVAVVYLAFPALVVARRLRSPRAGVWLVLGACVPLAVQVASWKILYGSWFVYSYGTERLDFGNLHVPEVLFSPLHGWFYWHPLLLPAVGAFVIWAVRLPGGRMFLASLVMITVLNAAWPAWWLGSSFGHRGFEAATLFAMIGGAALWSATTGRAVWRKALVVLSGIAIAWNLALFALFLTHRIQREGPVTYLDALRAMGGWISGAS